VLGCRLQPTLNLSLRAPAYLLLDSSSCDCTITLLLHSPPTLVSSSPSSPITTSQLLSVYTMISFFTISAPAALIAAIAACLSYSFAKAVYFLYFSPIAKFPGPKLAAASFWQVSSSHLINSKANLYQV
jgi:hypothetical protein